MKLIDLRTNTLFLLNKVLGYTPSGSG